jgi:hypothetical protein
MEDLHLAYGRRARLVEAIEHPPGRQVPGDGRQHAVAAVDVARARAPLDQQHARAVRVRQRQRQRGAAHAGARRR